MGVPALRERVRVHGRTGIFLIVGVDRERQVVDLISTTSGGNIEEDIPFDSLVPEDEPPSSKKQSPGGN